MTDEKNQQNSDEQIVSGNDGNGSSTNLDENVAALLSYLAMFVTGIIFVILEKKSKFVRFHAMQSVVFFGGIWVINIILRFIPFGGLIGGLLSLFSFVMWIIFMVKAYQKEYFKFPIAGQIAEDFVNKQAK